MGDDAQAMVAEMLMQLSESLKPINEAVEGYRQARADEGYSDTQSREMAVHYHAALMANLSR